MSAANGTLAAGEGAHNVLNHRLEVQRKRIFQVQAMCGLASQAGHQFADAKPTKRFATDVWCAMEAAVELLDEIAGRLDPADILEAGCLTAEERELMGDDSQEAMS
ncbi:MAG: hypothetical protein WDO56_35080 [Gammaproteobacteria bacterium]